MRMQGAERQISARSVLADISPPAEQKAALRIAIGTLTVAQHKQLISAASLKVSSAPLPRGRSSSACTTHPTF